MAKKAAKKTPAKKTRTQPRSVALPTMEEVRYKALDHLCESLGEIRDRMNQLRGEEGDLKRQALTAMRRHQLTAYRWAGIEMARIEGEEVLRVRASGKGATAGVVDGDDRDVPDEGEVG